MQEEKEHATTKENKRMSDFFMNEMMTLPMISGKRFLFQQLEEKFF